MNCGVCSKSTGQNHVFREMMFGTRKEFVYWECFDCGCIQIERVPEDMSEYYSEGYYSFGVKFATWKKLYYRAHYWAPRTTQIVRRPPAELASVLAVKPRARAHVLDVGCGGGRLVHLLRSIGLDAHGIDPFLRDSVPYLRRASLSDIEGEWDLIVFNHSLEHMQNQIDALRDVRKRLAKGGTCIVRMPVVNWAWRNYGRNWVQLDAPRHLMIHTPKSFRLAAAAAGLRAARMVFDSTDFQFRGSELYARDHALHDSSGSNLFSAKEIRGFRTQAKRLNAEQAGDQAAFYLMPD